MSDRIAQLKEEISSIIEQYQVEVSGRRKPWPRALKKRVLELTELGVPQIQLIHLTGISYMTILEWRKAAGMKVGKKVRKNKFHPLTVKPTAMTVVDEPKTVLPKTVRGCTVSGLSRPLLQNTILGVGLRAFRSRQWSLLSGVVEKSLSMLRMDPCR